MPVFTAIGAALGATAATATAVGIGATAVAAGVGAVAYQAGQGSGQDGSFDAPAVAQPAGPSADVGALTEAEAQTAAKKRAFRSGVLFTSPTGLDSDPRTSSAKLR